MEKNYLRKLTILSVLVASFLIVAGCGGSGSSTGAQVGVVFSDNFDSYALANPWMPAGGWTYIDVPSTWAIVAGLSGNGVQYVGTGSAFLGSSYTGTDYTVSVQARPTSIASNWQFGIFARDDGSLNRYGLFIADNTTTHQTTVGFFKFWNNSGNISNINTASFIAADLNTSTYYTLTLKVSGAVLTGTVTDGVNSQTITWTDDGLADGAIIPSGTAGLLIYSGPVYPVIFDNFTVTVP